MLQSKGQWGISAVILGVIALGLAIIPRALFDVPPPWPTKSVSPPQEVIEDGKAVEWQGIKITVGGSAEVASAPPPPLQLPTSAKLVFVTTAVIALAGIATGLIASWRERSYMLGGPAVALCSVALLWHYILIGVAVGVAFLVIVAILASVADAIST